MASLEKIGNIKGEQGPPATDKEVSEYLRDEESDTQSAVIDLIDDQVPPLVDTVTNEVLDETFPERVQREVPGIVNLAIEAGGGVWGGVVEPSDGDRAWGHYTDEDDSGRIRKLALGYTEDGHLDSFARVRWLGDVHDTVEIYPDEEWRDLVLTESGHILYGRRWDGSEIRPGLTGVVPGGGSFPRRGSDPAPASPTGPLAYSPSPMDRFVSPNNEVLPVLPNPTRMSGIGSSTMSGLSGTLTPMLASYGVEYYNAALGGTVTRHQGVRTGAIPGTFRAFTLPAGQVEVPVEFLDVPPVNSALQWWGTVLERPVILRKAVGLNSPWEILPRTDGSSVDVPEGTEFTSSVIARRADMWIFNPSKNDFGNLSIGAPYEEAIAQSEKIYNFISPLIKRVLVLGHFMNTEETNAEYRRKVLDANAYYADRYGSQFVDLSEYVTSERIWDDTGITPTADDLAQQALGNKPWSLSGDALHLNAAAYQAVTTNLIEPFLLESGWVS